MNVRPPPALAQEDDDTRALRIAAQEAQVPRLYPLLTAQEMAAKPLPRWRVRGLIGERGVGMMYGESGSLKSFLALDLAYAVADGRDWFGLKVNRAPVVYVCLEGNSGFGARVRAMEDAAPMPGPRDNLRFMDGGVFALDDETDLHRLAQSIRAVGCAPGTLVIVDTLACASGMADENNTRDARRLVQAAKLLAAFVDGFVLLVHHTGKDTDKGPRGGSNFRADTDCVIQVVKAGEASGGVGYWTSAKVKDGPDGGRFGFSVQWSVVGRDDEGREVTSGVVTPTGQPVDVHKATEETKPRGRPRAGGKNQQLVLNAIRQAMGNVLQIHHLAAMSAAVKAFQLADVPRASERARETITSLCNSGALTSEGDFYWLGDNPQSGVEP